MFTAASVVNNNKFISKPRKKHTRRRRMNNLINGGIVPGLSQSNWFWKSYQKATEWQGRHYLAYWRSRCIALEEENNFLRDCLTRYATANQKSAQDKPTKTVGKKKSKKRPKANDNTYQKISLENEHLEEVEGAQCDFEISEEMLDFFEQSARHKLERDSLHAAEEQKKATLGVDCGGDDDETNMKPPEKQVGQQRLEEMKLLYGEAAPMIMGMETSLQLTFDRNIDKRQPSFWPNIPLKL